MNHREIRTSESDPLRIPSIEISPRAGALGLTLCPGKICSSSFGGYWARDLDTDLHAILQWGAVAMLTLMETWELEEFGVPDLGARARALGIDWYHIAIKDGDRPRVPFEQAWPAIGSKLRAALLNGGRVVIHCRGGLGRTGTVAGLLLVELGWSADEAIKDVRRVRKHAIENDLQESYVRAWPAERPIGPESTSRHVDARA